MRKRKATDIGRDVAPLTLTKCEWVMPLKWKRVTALLTAIIFMFSFIITPPALAQTITVDGGTIDVSTQDSVTNWDVTGNPVWNVPEFNVPVDTTHNISGLNDGASLALLVGGGSASNIFGTMNLSNLDFILQNVFGINIGATGLVNVTNANFIASTLPLNLDSTNFLSHQYEFAGNSGFLMNEGRIVGHDASLVALVANAIENRGSVEVPMGTVALASGEVVTIGISGDGMVTIGVDAATANELGLTDQIKNSGTLQADGGKVVLTAKALDGLFEKAINIESEPRAVTAVKADDGILEFITIGDVYNNALIQAQNGKIKIESTQGDVINDGTLEAVKGSIEIDTEGNIETRGILRAETFREHGAAFRVGGVMEVGHAYLDNLDDAITYAADTAVAGTINDVADIIINAGVTLSMTDATTFNADSDSSGTGAFLMDSTATIAGGGHDLTLKASDNSTIGIIQNVGTLELGRNSASADITFASSTTVDDIDVDTFFTNTPTPTAVTFSKTVGNGTTTPLKIYDVTQLQAMGTNSTTLGYDYELANNIDASATSTWNSNAGFVPVGNNSTNFTGSLNGQNKVIAGLTINRSANFQGLFGVVDGAGSPGDGVIQDVGLVGGGIAAGTGNYVGFLAGRAKNTTITNTYSTGDVSGGSNLGGLVGHTYYSTSIDNSYATGTVSGTGIAGGLVGYAWDGTTIDNSYATGDVTGGQGVGGLVGRNYTWSGGIDNSYATGDVSGSSLVGGLAGNNFYSSIDNSYSTGTATGSWAVGGLVGMSDYGSSIDNSYSVGVATATLPGNTPGGLIGRYDSGALTNNWWHNNTNTVGVGNSSPSGVTKATTLSDFYGTGSGTGGAVYSGWTFGDGSGGWDSFASGLPHLDYEWSTSITSLLQLQNMNLDLANSYTLANNIDASSTPYWNSGEGFVPVGTTGVGNKFTGDFNGNSYTVLGLTIDRSANYQGLFGWTQNAAIQNVGLVGGSIDAGTGGMVGAIAGFAASGTSIINVYATSSVTGGAYSVGGLVGQMNSAGVANSYATGNVVGGDNAGGLVGVLDTASISNSYATGHVSGGTGVGGLVGTARVYGDIDNSYSTGGVSGTSRVGGLVGYTNYSSTIDNSYATGKPISTGDTPGGLIGNDDRTNTLTNNWWYNSDSHSYGIGNDLINEQVAGQYQKAGAATDFYASGSGTGGAVYSGWNFTPATGDWDRSAAYPRLQWEDHGFHTTWNTGTTKQITFPLVSSGSYDFAVEWGDGTYDLVTAYGDAGKTHIYAADGTYEVKVTGALEGWRFNNGGDKTKITGISQWGDLLLGNYTGLFYGTSNLDITATDILDTSGITNMSNMFRSSGVDTIPGISDWDTSNVTSMREMFSSSPNANPDLSGLDTSSVIDMTQMFYNATSADPDVSSWDTSNVTNMYAMFLGATSANPDVSNWDTASVTSMQRMFEGATSANPDVSNWDTSSVTNMWRVFLNATAADPDVSSWDTSSVTNMQDMFNGATSADPDVSNWDISSVTSISGMFRGITTDPDVSSWDTSNVTDMTGVFMSAPNANPDVSSWDTSSVTNMREMFNGATSADPDVSNWDISSVTSISGMFQGITTDPDVSSWDTSNVTNMYGVFLGATSANPDVSNWDTASVTSMQRMFEGATSANPDVSNWDTSSVTNMWRMFRNATAADPDVSSWDTSSVTNMQDMFNGATSADPDLSNWDVSNVTNMGNMFQGVTLSTINYSDLLMGWSTQNLQNGVNFNAGNSNYYSTAPAAARQAIIDNFGWTIADNTSVAPLTFNDVLDGIWNFGGTWGNAGSVEGTDYPGPYDTAVIDSNRVSLWTEQRVWDADLLTSGILNLAGRNFTANSLDISSTLELTGDEANVAGGALTVPTLNSGSTVEYTATSGTRDIQNWDYTNATLKINGAGGTFSLPDDMTASDVNIVAGTLDIVGRTANVNGLTGSGTLNNSTGTGTIVVGNNNATSTFSGVIQDTVGTLALNKVGTGTLTLSGANTYSGDTTLNAGKIVVSNDSALGTGTLTFTGDSSIGVGYNTHPVLSNSVAVNPGVTGTFAMGTQYHTINFTGPLTGTGDVVVTSVGNGAVTFSNLANTFTGKVTVGKASSPYRTYLTVNSLSDSSNPVQLYRNAYFTLGAGSASALVFNNRQIELLGSTGEAFIRNNNATTANTITINTDLVVADGSKTLTLGGSHAGNNAFSNTFGGAISDGSTGSLSLVKADAGKWRLLGDNTFSGGVTLNTGTLQVNNRSNIFGTGTLTINGGTLRANQNGQVLTTSNDQVWNNNFRLSRGITGTATWNFNGDVTLGDDITVTHADNFVYTNLNGVINDGGNNRRLTLAGNNGAFTLAGANTYGGGTTLSRGTLNINNASALGTGTFTITNGSIDNTSGNPVTLSTNNPQNWNNNFTFVGSNDLNLGAGAVTMNNNRTVTITDSTLTVGGAIGQSGGTRSLTKTGAGALVLSGANTYTGATTVSAGTLQIGDGITDGSIATSSGITDNASLVFNLVGSQTYGNVISGSGTLTKTGSGALTLSGTNTYSGGTTLNAGTLNINNAAAIGSGTFTLNGGAIDNTSGSAITLLNNNVQTWGGDFDFTGTNDLNLGAGAVTMSGNQQLAVNGGTLTFGGSISGPYDFTKAGSGTLKRDTNSLNLGGAFTISGGTFDANGQTTTVIGLATVSGGEYLARTALQTFNGGLTVSGGAFTGSTGNVDVNGSINVTSGTLTAPSGNLNISNDLNVASGATFTHNNGTVVLDTANAATVDVTGIAGGTLNFWDLTATGAGKIVSFGALDTFNVLSPNTFTATGALGNNLTLQSTISGDPLQRWNLGLANDPVTGIGNWNFQNVTLKDVDNVNIGAVGFIDQGGTVMNLVDGGNNLNAFYVAPPLPPGLSGEAIGRATDPTGAELAEDGEDALDGAMTGGPGSEVGGGVNVLSEKFRNHLEGQAPLVSPLKYYFTGPMPDQLMTDVRTLEGKVYFMDRLGMISFVAPGTRTGPIDAVTPQDGISLGTAEPLPLPLPEPSGSGALPVVRTSLLLTEPDFEGYKTTLNNPGGDVSVWRRGGSSWIPANDGMQIAPGDEIRTGKGSTVEVTLDNGDVGTLEIQGGTIFRFNKLRGDAGAGFRTTLIDLAIGKLVAKVERLTNGSKFEIRSPTGITGVQGTVFEIEVQEITEGEAIEGVVEDAISGPGAEAPTDQE